MNNPPISFRLTEQEWEVLKREKQDNESINQTAARLLREKLGIVDNNSEYLLENSTLEFWISDTVNTQLELTKTNLENLISEEISKINQRLDKIEKRLPKPRSPKTAKNDLES